MILDSHKVRATNELSRATEAGVFIVYLLFYVLVEVLRRDLGLLLFEFIDLLSIRNSARPRKAEAGGGEQAGVQTVFRFLPPYQLRIYQITTTSLGGGVADMRTILVQLLLSKTNTSVAGFSFRFLRWTSSSRSARKNSVSCPESWKPTSSSPASHPGQKSWHLSSGTKLADLIHKKYPKVSFAKE